MTADTRPALADALANAEVVVFDHLVGDAIIASM